MVRCYPFRSPICYRVTARDYNWRKFLALYMRNGRDFSDIAKSVHSFNRYMSYW